jgi:hypothetical protein
LSAILSGRIWRTEGQHGSGIHYTANQARDFKIESGIASAGRRDEEDDAGQGTTKNVSSGKKKNFSGTESPVEESQGSREVTPSLFRD